MNEVNAILEFFRQLSPLEAALWLFVQNVIQFAMCVVGGQLLIMCFSKRRIVAPPEKPTSKQVTLSIMCVFLNTVVAVGGWFLWKEGIIRIKTDIGWWMIFDTVVLLIMMDFLMYVSHRMAHHPLIFSLVHETHHGEEHPRPLSLFVLSPMEVFGYGLLWLLVLTLYQSSWLGIVVYLLLNAAFGAIGHLGVEPFPRFWLSVPILSEVTTSTFHAQHHTNGSENFGFYTSIWDRLFGTLSKTYKELFESSASGNCEKISS